MSELFFAIYQFFSKRRKLFVVFLLLLLLISSLSVTKLRFEENIYSFFPKSSNFEKVSSFLQNSPLVEKIIISVSINEGNIADPDMLVNSAGEFTGILRDKFQPKYVKTIKDTVSEENLSQIHSVFYNNLPLFMTEDDYKNLETRLDRDGIDKSIERNYKFLMSPGSMVLKEYMLKDPLGISFQALRQMQTLQIDDNYHLYSNYILTKDDRNLLIFINPAFPSNMTSDNLAFFKLLDIEISKIVKKYDGKISIDYYGVPVVSADNASQIQKDIFFTVSIALIIILFIVFAVIKEKRLLFVLLLPVIFGFAFSIGMLFVIKGKISLISLGIGSALLGIMIDYAIHVSTHFRSMHPERSKFKETVFPVVMCCATNVSGFLCLYLVKSDMLKDLSLFAVFNMIGAAFFSLIIVPHFYRYKDLKEHKEYRYRSNKYIKWLFSHDFEKSRLLIFAVIAITIVCSFFITKVQFEDDLIKLNYTSEKVALVEKKFAMFDKIKQKSVMLITESNNLDSALVKNELIYNAIKPLQNNGSVEKIISISPLLNSGSEQDKKIERWKKFWTPERILSVKRNIESSSVKYSFKPGVFSEFYSLLGKDFSRISEKDFKTLKDAVFPDLVTENNGQICVVTMIKAERNSMDKFYSLYEKDRNTFSDVIVADKQYLTNKFIDMIKAEFNSLSIIDSVLIFTILLIFLGRFELAAISFIPIALSWVWILGLMGMTGIKFNIFNIIISSIIFGLGVDYSIIMIQGLIHQYRFGGHGLESSRESIFFSALTNITGMGVLFFAKHPALKSIAVISSIGILSVYIISNIIPPLLFKFIIKRKHSIRPLKISVIINSSIIYFLFVLGCLNLAFLGMLMQLLPVGKKRRQRIFSLMIMYSCRFLSRYSIISPLYANFKVENVYNETFKKPGVIIANHQSMLDIIFILSLSPKIIVLTKEWVWKSHIMGLVVRLAGYFPATTGIENYMDDLKERVKDGYSILVFPEGTRSGNASVGRFRKGAFLLADKLNLDIIPLIIHGTGDIIRKNTLAIYSGTALIKITKRISFNNSDAVQGYSEKSKSIRKIISDEFVKIRKEREVPKYFSEFLVDKYIYKDPILEWYMRIKLKIEKNYEFLNSIIPDNASIVDIGCGYGFLSYMLALASNDRIITGIDYDSEKINVAKNITIPALNVSFESADAVSYQFPESDVFIMSDMLHYMPSDVQVNLIVKCMSKLNKDGMIIIRDANKDLSGRHFYTRVSEIFSTRLKFNKTKYKNMFFISRSLIQETASANNFSIEIYDRSIKTSNEIYILKKQ